MAFGRVFGGMDAMAGRHTSDAWERRDQWTVRAGQDIPVTYMPFKFESKRSRLDWRMLHGVDVNKVMRDTDLDTLERVVAMIAYGDIEAEDTRHLTELNFVKVFRLAQLLLEYLLYVQDNLKYTNTVLEHGRAGSLAHMSALRSRCRELDAELKHSKRELRRARKTAKTYELMAEVQKRAAPAPPPAPPAAPPSAAPAAPAYAMPAVPGGQQTIQITNPAADLLLQQQQQLQLDELSERLAAAAAECGRLTSEREELQYQIRRLHEVLMARTGGLQRTGAGFASPGSSHTASLATQQQQQQQLLAQLAAAQARIAELERANQSLQQHGSGFGGSQAAERQLAELATHGSSLRAQLQDREQQLEQAQGAVEAAHRQLLQAQQEAQALRQQARAQQADAATPEGQQQEAVRLARQLAVARDAWAVERKQLEDELSNARAAAQKATAKKDALKRECEQQQEALDQLHLALRRVQQEGAKDGSRAAALGGSDVDDSIERDWKLEEIERLQGDKRRLEDKVHSLQEALADAEQKAAELKAQLGRAEGAFGAAAAARNSTAHDATAHDATANDATASQIISGDGAAAAQGPATGWSAGGDEEGAGASDAGTDEGAEELVGAAEEPAVATSPGTDVEAAAAKDKAGLENGPPNAATDGRIAAYRPAHSQTEQQQQLEQEQQQQQQQQGPLQRSLQQFRSQSPQPPNPGPSQAAATAAGPEPAAAAALQAAAEALAAAPADELAALHQEYVADWEEPFTLSAEEEDTFRALLPHDMPWRPGVLAAAAHSAQELAAARPAVVASLNVELDGKLAGLGLAPGTERLSDIELMAAMKQLEAQRSAWLATLPQEDQDKAEVLRLALLLHVYNTTQAIKAAGEVPLVPAVLRSPPATEPVLPAISVSRLNATAAASPATSRYGAHDSEEESPRHPSSSNLRQPSTTVTPAAAAAAGAMGGNGTPFLRQGSHPALPESRQGSVSGRLQLQTAQSLGAASSGSGGPGTPVRQGSLTAGQLSPGSTSLAASAEAFSPMQAAFAARRQQQQAQLPFQGTGTPSRLGLKPWSTAAAPTSAAQRQYSTDSFDGHAAAAETAQAAGARGGAPAGVSGSPLREGRAAAAPGRGWADSDLDRAHSGISGNGAVVESVQSFTSTGRG